MSKHTPGPWVMYQTPNDPDFVAEIEGVASVYAVSGDALANANLIAAAPELLDALGILLNRLEGIGGEHVTGMEGVDADLIKANAAIAKATGVEQ